MHRQLPQRLEPPAQPARDFLLDVPLALETTNLDLGWQQVGQQPLPPSFDRAVYTLASMASRKSHNTENSVDSAVPLAPMGIAKRGTSRIETSLNVRMFLMCYPFDSHPASAGSADSISSL